jgi:hypothetical protein
MALTKVTKELIQGSLSVEWQSAIKTSSFQSITGQGYFVNTTASAVTVTMPATASVGDIVSIVDYAGTAQTNNITITAALNINGSANDVKINYERGAVSIVYSGTAEGWVAEVAANDGTDALVDSPPTFSVDYLVLAGGGGGGEGGGGAGGYLTNYGGTPLTTTLGTPYTVTVGAGGAGGIASSNGVTGASSGSNSIFSSIISNGGGFGGYYSGSSYDGGAGGSGGGGRRDGGSNGGAAVTTPVVQGYSGGTTASMSWGGAAGGGGATAVGLGGSGGSQSSETGGIGGNGLAVSITGSSVTYAGGGGGGVEGLGGNGTGGTGGGGTGGGPNFANSSGTTNLGGGGGGTAMSSLAPNGGAGGSGIVILRYPTVDVSSFAVTGTLDTTANTAYPIANTVYYKLEGGSGTTVTDSSGNGYNGTATSVTYAAGRFGQAAVFNGSSSVITSSSAGTAINVSSLSFSLWFKTNLNDSTDRILINSYDGSGNERFYASLLNSGLSVVIYDSSSAVYIQNFINTVTTGTWYHLSVTHTGTTTTVYLNGTPITPSATTGTAVAIKTPLSPPPLTMGQLQDYPGTYAFNGSIDQVRIFNSALSAGNVTSLYNEGTVVESTDGTDSILQFIGGTGTVTFTKT